MVNPDGTIRPLIIKVGPLMEGSRHRYGVTTPWFSTWIDVSDEVHHMLGMDIHHPLVTEELRDAVARVFGFHDVGKCFFHDKGDSPRLWGSF